ncbi:MAG: glycosyltransferase [Firmicutes bacterium]|nr:glycosyltransferase [Bacillota bacterium]
MRVLHVSSDYTLGGASRYLLTLFKQPAFSSIDATVACPEGGPLWDELRGLGVKVDGFPQRDRSLDPALTFRLLGLIRKNRFDIVHTHASLSARVASRLARGPNIVVTRHTLLPPAIPPRSPLGHVRRAVKCAIVGTTQALLADRFIAVSEAVRHALLAEGIPEDMIETIHNGVDVAELEREAGRGGGLSTIAGMAGPAWAPGSPVVGTVGRLSHEKGHEIFVRAAPHVLSAVPSALFVIVGHGGERERLEVLARGLGVAGRFVFAGYQDNATSWMSAFDVFVMPSLGEGLGIALLEAMALRKPVVASNTGGIPEVVQDGANGLLVSPGDPLHLAVAVTRLLRDGPLATRIAAAGRESVLERFSAAAMAERTAAVYTRLSGMRGAAPRRAPQGR